jgi:predicted AAA+ superfamily ATPase
MPEGFEQVLLEQNPWHQTHTVPDVWAPPVERPLAMHLWKRLHVDKPRRFQVVMGPRRVGKSTAMYQTVRHLLAAQAPPGRLWWLRLDHPLLIKLPIGPLIRNLIYRTRARRAEPIYLFLDEVTYSQDWDLWLKTLYDERWPVRLAGTSSATAALREGRTESGVGRWEEQYLAPCLFTEFLQIIHQPVAIPVQSTLWATIAALGRAAISVPGLPEQRRRFLLTGGFPELLIERAEKLGDEASLLLESQRTLRSDAVERAVYKDIPAAFDVDDPLLLERLLYTLAGQIAGILSPSGICQSLGGLTQPTFDRYLSYFERAFLVFTLANYSGAEASKQKRGRKLYFVDSAVRNATLQRGLAPLNDAAEMGLLIENLVASHLYALSQQSQVRLYHWHERDVEVDLIYDHPDSPIAFEIASSMSHRRDGLLKFAERFPRFRGRCFLVAPNAPSVQPAESQDGVGTLPLDLLLLAAGAQAEAELAARLAT